MSAITYKCPNCDGGLVFDPESGTYACEYCLSKFTQEDLVAESQEAEPVLQEESVQEDNPEETTTESADSQKSAVMYHCPSCGAEIITDETTAATFCFYCHNPIVLAGKLEGEYLPDGIIPFKITKEEATEKFMEWIQKKKFVPTGFSSKRHIEKMSGVYFPYWLYGCETDSYMNGTARNIRIWRVGDIEYTETKVFQVRRAGKVSFRHLPKTALQKAQNAMLKGIFPYEFGALEKFHMGYLSGFQAEKRDIDKETLSAQIRQEIQKYAEKRMRDTITGRNSFSMESQNHAIAEEKYQYTLLPVWVLTYRQGNQIYYFAMNGQTGEVVGKLPIDNKKLFGLGGIIFAVVFIILMIGGLLV